MSLPNYNFLPAPLLWINILHITTFTLHLIAMNCMLGAVIIVLWAKLRGDIDNKVVQKIIQMLPNVMAITISLGVAPLLFLQLVYPKQVYPAAIVSGLFFLMIVPVLIVAYYCLYSLSFAKKNWDRRHGALLFIALLGLLYVSFVYSSVFSMAEQPLLVKNLYAADQSGLSINTNLTGYIFRWLHMIFGSVMVGSFFIAWIGRHDEHMFKIAKIFFLVGIILATLSGVAYFFSLGEYLRPLMRHPVFHFLLLGIVLSIGSIHFFFKKKFLASGLMIFISMIAMVTTRHTLRILRLADHYNPALVQVSPQWSVFALFIVFFVIMLGLVAYMLRLYLKE